MHPPHEALKYRRILLKLSGEALAGDEGMGVSPKVLDYLAGEIAQLTRMGVELALVIGGGNFIRGRALQDAGMDRVTGDHMGMLATVMNALAVGDALKRFQLLPQIQSAIEMQGVAARYSRADTLKYLEQGQVVVFAAGTGNPFFTTDSAACLRGIEIQADIILKATKVDGIFDQDPVRHSKAVLFKHLSYDEVLKRQLKVMDLTSICLVREHQMPLRVFNMAKAGALKNIVSGGDEGTLIDANITWLQK